MPTKRNPYLQLAKFSWSLGKKYRTVQIFYYVIFILSITVSSLNPFLYKWLIDEIQTTTHILQAIWIFATLSVFLKIFEWLVYAPAYFKTRNIGFELSTQFLVDLHVKVMDKPTKWHQENHMGATVNRIKKSSDALKKFLNDDFHYLKVFFRFIFAMIGMIYFAPLYGVATLLIGAGIVYLTMMLDHKYLVQLNQVNEKDYLATSVLLDNLSNHQTVTSLKLHERITANFQLKIRQLAGPYFKSVTIDALKWASVEILVVVIYVVMAIGYVYDNYQPGQRFPVGGLVAMLAYTIQFTSGFQDMAWLYAMIIGTYADFSATEQLRSAQEVKRGTEEELSNTWATIMLNQVSYLHGDADARKFVLTDVDFKIKKGQKIALIGASGSGKTTLLKLMRGLYTHQEGSVWLDQKKIGWEQLEQLVLFLPQEAEIFNDSILYNLCLGLETDIPAIRQVCKMTLFDRVIERLPEGLNTVIDQRGGNLSGGERQLLALTRCILLDRSSQLLLFDEPTSSIDPSGEAVLLKNIFSFYSDKSVVFTLHRHYLLPMFDYIYLMEEGRVIWKGTYQNMLSDELVSKYVNQKTAIKYE
ncbi:ATP-binding cassette domain-containing protein [Pedobacter hartonius]|uniref:ABC-type bacteriocin/lantibiotic exporter, contains an N-terminal double-glycine peptidase domain n=1 Tax=Pedobacter hartonius TaxID=425514 RepID=A0A1H4GCC0_9SPHI|nr:ABC transporter ATP-binding protein [Pedobacter hartonius]SEB06941.1 ABC-type bacteriocin/lantibiotic exporter, contains an N-terminal double-glycine peptidase domain [Pedobacter hartonius]